MGERYLIVSGANKAQEDILFATNEGREALSKHSGWGLLTATEKDYIQPYHPSWQKIDVIKAVLPYYDAVLWLDADSFVTNPKACPMPAETAFTISEDWCAPDTSDKPWISCGNFWTRNKPEAFEFFEQMEKYKSVYAFRDCCCWEQDAFHQVLWKSPLKSEVTILPRTAMNSVKCKKEGISTRHQYERGDFLCHLTNVPDRTSYIPQLKKDLIQNT
jgi:hypothetical protein